MYKGEKRTMYNAWQTPCMQHPFGTQERQPSIRERKSKHYFYTGSRSRDMSRNIVITGVELIQM